MLDERERVLAEREKNISLFEDIELPRLRRKAVIEGTREGHEKGLREAEEALAAWTEKMKQRAAAQLRRSVAQHTQRLVDEFLDRKDRNGRSFRPIFERYVDQRLVQFAHDHDVVDDMTLEPGDREQFIRDGGVSLAAEVEMLKVERERGYGE